MIIDSHQHFWRYDPAHLGWLAPHMVELRRDWLPEDLAPHLKEAGVERTIAVQARDDEAETEFLVQQATVCDWIAGVVGWVDLAADDAEERIVRWQQTGRLVGLRHPMETDQGSLHDQRFDAGVGAAQRRGLVYDVLVKHTQLRGAIEFCERHYAHAVVMDHLAKPPITGDVAAMSVWRNAMSELAMLPHVSVKLSGLATVAQASPGAVPDTGEIRRYLDAALELFGEERLLFGSDWPVCRLATTYADWFGLVDSWLSAQGGQCRRRVFGANAASVYGLDV